MQSRHGRPAEEAGYSILELIVAMGIALSLLAATFPLATGLQSAFGAESERSDGQQRLRVAFEALSRDLLRAGTGVSQGENPGPLAFVAPALFPFRQGATRADPPGTFHPDVLTIVRLVDESAAQTTIRQALPAQSGAALLNSDPGCPVGDAACGFSVGMDLLVYDGTGAYDTFRVSAVAANSLQLQHTMTDGPKVYAPGARVAQAVSDTYYLKTDASTDTFQLMHYDGVSSDAAVADHVVSLAFEYFGEPAAPLLLRPVSDPTGPWTTYGPKPPPIGAQTSGYPAGENCVFQTSSGVQVSRLGALGGSTTTTLVGLAAAQLQDGPWCPDATDPHRYDADLFRVRRVAVTLRVESSLAAFRGPAGVLFVRPGTARSARSWAPDQEIRFDITPRNLSFGR